MSLSTDVKSLTVSFGAAVGRGQRLALGVTTFLVLLLFGTFFSSLAQATQNISPASLFETNIQPAFETHCVKCHGQMDVVEGDVNLRELSPDRLGEHVELLSSLVTVLDLNEMPPEDEPAIKPELRQRMVADLKAIVRTISASRAERLSAPIRRMNRFQYDNAITDLFDLKCNVFTLPERIMREHQQYFKPETGKMADVVAVGNRPLGKSQMIERRLAGVAAFPQDLRAEHGFDTQGDHLSMSPLLMESFLKLGQSITQSPDFTKRNVGIWKSFFAPPGAKQDTGAEVRDRLNGFLYRAFRRPVNAEVLNRYTQFVTGRLEAGVGFSEAMKSVAAAVIASPRFLYLYDVSPAVSQSESMNGFELASRLSFFLWGSIPDQLLLDMAESGELNDPQVVRLQIDRMLTDRKIKRFCDSFPAQWLQLDRIISSLPDPEKYPGFYFLKYRDSMHMMLEPLLLFETVLIENLPLTQLIDSDFTYRSPVLQQAYEGLGKQPLSGSKTGAAVGVLSFSRVPVEDRRNGGVITNAAVMTMTSGPDRTQPITRGAWVASVIFNDPPEPPPADVPPLDEKPSALEEKMTLRERLSAHRKQADCKGCHEQIDPLGFALENYNAIGVWREQYENGRKVDSSGSLFRTHPFNDIIEFKDAILTEKHRFARAMAGHLLAFGLARRVGPADQAALDQIVEAAAADNYRIQTLIKQVILSQPFHSRTNLTVPPDSEKPNVHPKR